jgi:hypothetical protein
VPVLLCQLHLVVAVNTVKGRLELTSSDRLGDLSSRRIVYGVTHVCQPCSVWPCQLSSWLSHSSLVVSPCVSARYQPPPPPQVPFQDLLLHIFLKSYLNLLHKVERNPCWLPAILWDSILWCMDPHGWTCCDWPVLSLASVESTRLVMLPDELLHGLSVAVHGGHGHLLRWVQKCSPQT